MNHVDRFTRKGSQVYKSVVLRAQDIVRRGTLERQRLEKQLGRDLHISP